jgi:hypothetical protein
MMTSTDSLTTTYGVKGALGPQIYTIYRSVNSTGHHWSSYLKWASLLDSGGFAWGNRELAVGGSYFPWKKRGSAASYYSLTGDLAFVSYRTFNSASLSFGISRKF